VKISEALEKKRVYKAMARRLKKEVEELRK